MTEHTPRHCHLCGKHLGGRAWTYTPEGAEAQTLIVCRRCQETAPRCDVCNLPMGANHTRLPDGRLICPRCHRTAIYDPTQARELFEEIAAVITNQLGLGLAVGTEFTMVDYRHLQRLVRETTSHSPDDPGKVIGLFARKGRSRVMYLLYGLPRILFIQVAAHEWGHAWHRENCPLLNTPEICEGFAEWVAYRTLQTLGASKKAALMARRQDTYGEGLREMLARERRHGIDGVLDFCRRSE